jgi:hypothetical protein
VLLGAGTLFTSPVDNTTPLVKGKLVLVFVKYPMLFVEPNCVPDLKFTLVALTWRINQYFINKFTGGV